MFNFIFSSVQAYNQVGLFLGALFCLGLGGLILGNDFYWRLHALRASGVIIGVITKKGMCAPVYRYTLPDGQTHEAQSDTSSSSIRGKETGRVVPLMISAHNPTQARVANNYLFDVIGLIMLVPGFVLGYVAVTAFPVTKMTWIIAGALLLYMAEHVRRIVIPKGSRVSLEEWRKQHGLSPNASIDLAQVTRVEQIVPSAEALRSAQQQFRQSRKWAPVVGIFAVILVVIGIHQSMRLANLEAAGLHADGQVVRSKEEESSGADGISYNYYPIVQFHTRDSLLIEFKDSIGSNPPSHRPGDRVVVLYLASDPLHTAIIDRGRLWNWALPTIIFVAALLVFGLMIVILRSNRRPTNLARRN